MFNIYSYILSKLRCLEEKTPKDSALKEVRSVACVQQDE
jgi:hypothetical protein